MNEVFHVEDQESIDSIAEQQRLDSAKRTERAAKFRSVVQNAGIMIPFVAVMIFGIFAVPNFTSASNITNILVNSGILAIAGFGMTVVIAMRGIDLSVGSAQALCACAAALAMGSFGVVVGVLTGIILGVILGVINGSTITFLKVPDFITTLSTLNVFRGAVLLLTGGAPVMIASQSFKSFSTNSVLGVPLPFLIAVVIAFGVWFLMNHMTFGKYAVTVGVNPAAARDSGISMKKTIILGYALAGGLAGIAGVLLASQLGVVNGSISSGLELQVIAIVVLGGTSMAGGRARIAGTFIAALLLSSINSGLNLMNVPSFYQYVALGVLLIFALTVDSAQRAAVKRLLQGRKFS